VERAKLYFSEGADVVFPEALLNRKEFSRFPRLVKGPLLANMTEFGKTPMIKAQEFRKMGFRFVIFPVTAFRAAARAQELAYSAILKEGTQEGIIDRLMTRSEQYEVIRYDSYTRMDSDISSGRRKVRKGG
jgi:methylisocitrate lyase